MARGQLDVQTCAHNKIVTAGTKALSGSWQPPAKRRLSDRQPDRQAAKWTGSQSASQSASQTDGRTDSCKMSQLVSVRATLLLLSAVMMALPLLMNVTPCKDALDLALQQHKACVSEAMAVWTQLHKPSE